MDSNKADEQLVASKPKYLSGYEPFDDDVTGLIFGAEYNSQANF
jgi:hypothetical protein